MLTEDEKSRARHHTGYGEVQDSQTFVMGIPAGVQVQFMIEGGLNRIMASGERRFRKLLDRLDRVEEKIEDSTDDLEADEVGGIKLKDKAFEKMIQRYKYWQGALCNLMQVPPNPNDQRFSAWAGGGTGINVPMIHG